MQVRRCSSVRLVLHEFCRGWIIEKMALKLCEALRDLGVDAAVSERPSPDAAINHFMIFHYVDVMPQTLNTMAVTHVDDMLKVDMVRRRLANGVRAAVCMSSMTAEQLTEYNVDRERLTYALPAHDVATAPRRLVVGITSANYSDGRKRDWLLTRLADDMPLDDFEFRIFGRGWEAAAARLEAAGAKVELHSPTADYKADYEAIKAAIPQFDYYFYPGLDEGSMGALDALAAGVKTIITRQGFHLDIPHGVTHGFWDYDELLKIFREIRDEMRGRVEAAQALTWARYAQRHLDIWNALLERDELPPGDRLYAEWDSPRGEVNKFPVLSYRELLADPFRREMALRFWTPALFKFYLALRRFRQDLGLGSKFRKMIRASGAELQ